MRRAVKYSPRLDELLGAVAAGAGALGEGGELLADGIGEAELVGDIEVAPPDVGEQVVAGDVVVDVGVDQVEQVGHLGVARGAAAAGGHDDEAARGVGIDDALDLPKVLGVGDGGAAELGDLNHCARYPFPDRRCPVEIDEELL